jgi:hypothetical protein
MNWTNEFKNRMHDFENQFNEKNSFALSIKIRITSGCFHREHSPEAYKIIDNEIKQRDPRSEKIAFIEHESGPEILVYLAVTAATIQLSASVIDLIKAIIDARSKGIEKGDRPHDDLHIIVRGFDKNGELKDETVCKINHLEKIDKKTIKTVIESSINKTLKNKNVE